MSCQETIGLFTLSAFVILNHLRPLTLGSFSRATSIRVVHSTIPSCPPRVMPRAANRHTGRTRSACYPIAFLSKPVHSCIYPVFLAPCALDSSTAPLIKQQPFLPNKPFTRTSASEMMTERCTNIKEIFWPGCNTELQRLGKRYGRHSSLSTSLIDRLGLGLPSSFHF